MRPRERLSAIISSALVAHVAFAQQPPTNAPDARTAVPSATAAEATDAQSAPTNSPVVTLENPPAPAPETASPLPAAAPPPTNAPAPAPSADAPAPGAAPPSTPVRELPVAAAKERAVPVRKERKYALAGEIGWNSLAGLGVNGTYNVIPRLSLDLGAGLSQVGYKGGVRIRGNLLQSAWTPVAGIGYLIGSGTFGKAVKVKGNNDEELEFRLRASHYLQGVVGVNYTSDGGFAFMATAGYAWLLRENFVKVSGSDELADDVKPAVHGGAAIATSFGWAF